MKIDLEIDDELVKDAMDAKGVENLEDAIKLGLELLLTSNQGRSIGALRGKLKWEGNLDEMRGAD